MRRYILQVFLFLFIYTNSYAQIEQHVKWSTSIVDNGDNKATVIVKGILDNGWHLYSKETEAQLALPTTIDFEKQKGITIVGGTQEAGDKAVVYSDLLKGNLIYFKNKVQYSQKITLNSPTDKNIKGEINYQICSDNSCLAPESELFSLALPTVAKKEDKVETALVDTIKGQPLDTVAQYTTIAIDSTLLQSTINTTDQLDLKKELIVPSIKINNPLNKSGDKIIPYRSYIWLFILGFIGGILALLTPCVYPMIPITISYFTKQAHKGTGKTGAYIYALFIFLIFVGVTLPFYLIDNVDSNFFNRIATNIWVNLAFFIAFIIFAFSLFGFIDLSLPSWLTNSSEKASNNKNIIGLFFMALSLVIMSFSCTGPILGSILANAIQHPKQLTVAFGACGLAWGIVFGGLALFPQLLKTMPKSGSWMNTLKVVLGFIELALAFKFLSKADLVSKTFLFKKEIFIAIWAILSIITALYLFGVFNKKEKIKTLRRSFATLFLLFAGYLVIGAFPKYSHILKPLGGILPPNRASLFKQKTNFEKLTIVDDFEEALALAQKENKNILVDFTGYGCENCRKMEEFVWTEPEVFNELKDNFIIASLYVDDIQELPIEEQRIQTLKSGKQTKIKTIGNKWSTFEKENFNSNAQPFYAIINTKLELVNYPVAGDMDKKTFLAFLISK